MENARVVGSGGGGTDSNKALETWSHVISSDALLERVLVVYGA